MTLQKTAAAVFDDEFQDLHSFKCKISELFGPTKQKICHKDRGTDVISCL